MLTTATTARGATVSDIDWVLCVLLYAALFLTMGD